MTKHTIFLLIKSYLKMKADRFFEKDQKWQLEMETLREIVLECDLEEEVKWMHPCYTYQNSNIVLIHSFKDYCALLFFKGVLMKDPAQLLIQQTENVQDRRQLRFVHLEEIVQNRTLIKAYILEAIEIEKAGLKVEYKPTSEFTMPEEFKELLDHDEAIKTAFEQLTPGRQRGYLLHFSSAKQAKTRIARIEKYLPKIMEGKGMED